MKSEKHKQIAKKNDLFRTTFFPFLGKLIFTDSVASDPNRERIITAVREFNTFNEDNDPHGEHDFGRFTVEGEKFFWKIDYYDSNYEFFQEDGNRVLTIMRAEEY